MFFTVDVTRMLHLYTCMRTRPGCRSASCGPSPFCPTRLFWASGMYGRRERVCWRHADECGVEA